MNDRELLELAAKAAGIARVDDGLYANPHIHGNGVWWNPLTDDGDALRLAVKLGIDLKFFHGSCYVYALHGCKYIDEPYGDDIHAATRRAIVSAAAEIGRAMP